MQSEIETLRSAAAGARLLVALTHPDLASIIAALPRRPGATITPDALRTATGLDLRAFAHAVARGRTCGVLSVDHDGAVTLDRGHVDATVDRLVGLSPWRDLVGDDVPGDRLDYGRWSVITDDPVLLGGALAHLRARAGDAPLTETEVNDHLLLLTDDTASLRRALVDSGRLHRTPDGSTYRVTSA